MFFVMICNSDICQCRMLLYLCMQTKCCTLWCRTEDLYTKSSGKRPSRTPRQKTLYWITDKGNGKTYGHLKEKTQWREKWRQRCTEPVSGQRT